MPRRDNAGIARWLALSAVVLIVLAATGVWNPLAPLWRLVHASRPLADAGLAWQQRLGGTPHTVTLAGDVLVAEHRDFTEARALADGRRRWRTDADWSAVAGDGRSAVVVTGELLTEGYRVLDPGTGRALREEKRAAAVWTYRDAVLDLGCAAAGDCALTAWAPRGSRPRWRVPLPSPDFVLFADNPPLPGARPLAAPAVPAAAAGPAPLPPVLGFPVGDTVYVVDTAAGALRQEAPPAADQRVVVAGGRVLRIRAEARDGGCWFDVAATDPGTQAEAWARPELNLRTVRRGCVQRDDPSGGESVLVGVDPGGRELLVDAYDGRTLWRAADRGERVAGVDSRRALVVGGGGLRGVAFGAGARAWQRRLPDRAQVALTPAAALVVDRAGERITALRPETGAELLSTGSTAKVVAVGPAGLVLLSGADIGYARFAPR
ncbi:hypothetical protein GCM10010123_29870 [Pilimelia anulata]|uniref:Uncharacterized protein n=1 Tax=Pilimelia anulata TaxID=53371 RepID=A0A8J3B6Z0_9ACTN|nr:PQQ-binding-like beta-propeller repeat protein [Pilimelia anulata]GGJ97822.1 hypothetical protein GCM10010123_29870 [Pilimelia anulata]